VALRGHRARVGVRVGGEGDVMALDGTQ
jgi:hypothetical protein